MLFGSNDLPLHFLKVLDFSSSTDDAEEGKGLTKPQLLFLFILFDSMFEEHTKDEIKAIFKKGLLG